MLRLEQLRKKFPDGTVAADDVDLHVAAGQLVGIVGPSGSGKTTLLRLIAGLETPDAGKVWIDGHEMTRAEPHQRNVGMIFQTAALWENLRVYENLAFGAWLRAGPPAGFMPTSRWRLRNAAVAWGIARLPKQGEVHAAVANAATIMQLDGQLDKRPAELSGGQRQRVALGRAIVRKPAALLFDEPFAHLDIPLRRQLGREVADLVKRLNVPAILVTHDLGEAEALTDQVYVSFAGGLFKVNDLAFRSAENHEAAQWLVACRPPDGSSTKVAALPVSRLPIDN